MSEPARSTATFEYAVLDHLERLEAKVDSLDAPKNVTPMWLDKKELARGLRRSVRWIEYRVDEGMPCRELGGRLQFNLAAVENWLRKAKLLKEINQGGSDGRACS